MEEKKEENGFLITCITCVVILLVMCYFGINNSLKITKAIDTNKECYYNIETLEYLWGVYDGDEYYVVDDSYCTIGESGSTADLLGNTCGFNDYFTKWTKTTCEHNDGYTWNESMQCCRIPDMVASGPACATQTGEYTELTCTPPNVWDIGNQCCEIVNSNGGNSSNNGRPSFSGSSSNNHRPPFGGNSSNNSSFSNNSYSSTGESSFNSSSSSTSDNVAINPVTGEIAIFIVLIIGIASIIYSIWYYRSVNNLN